MLGHLRQFGTLLFGLLSDRGQRTRNVLPVQGVGALELLPYDFEDVLRLLDGEQPRLPHLLPRLALVRLLGTVVEPVCL